MSDQALSSVQVFSDDDRNVAVDVHDLVFVGAGASTAYTLLGLLAQLSEHPPASPLRICVVEKDTHPFSGLPYGGRAAKTCLIITSLRDFLPDDERALFAEWLAVNKSWVFNDFLAAAGPFGRQWWAQHRAEIERDEFDSLFLPRYTFGIYLMDRTRKAIDRAHQEGVARTQVVRDEVCSIDAVDSYYVLACRGRTMATRRVVLATGSPLTRPRLRGWEDRSSALLLDAPFDDMPAALERISAAVRQKPAGDPPHIVILGGNASTMDMLYQINDSDLPEMRNAVITVLTPRGELPARMDEAATAAAFRPEQLEALETADDVRAVSVYEAAVGDIARGKDLGLSAADTMRPVSRAVGRLLPRLSDAEVAEFAGRWGVELGRHQRRAGLEYWEVVERLSEESRIRLAAGAFVGLTVTEAGNTFVSYRKDGVVHRLDAAADIVINCAGAARDIRAAAPALVEQLITRGICRPTSFGTGIAVDASLAAAPEFYVMGPLLAGNVVNDGPIWHMEHCGRISAFGWRLGRRLADSLATTGR